MIGHAELSEQADVDRAADLAYVVRRSSASSWLRSSR